MRELLLQDESDLHVDLVAFDVAILYQDVLILHPRAFDTPEGLGGTGYGLLYGIVLCNARAMGEFGAVYVVSGHIAGETDTMPLRVEKLFQEYNLPGSFAVASVLTLLALVTLGAKTALEHVTHQQLAEAAKLEQPETLTTQTEN